MAAGGLFEQGGPLAARVPGFSPRPQQKAMAEAVAEAMERAEALVVEAGTGTGKTYAYLVPALRSGRRVIVSTGTRNLQDQLFQKDIPMVRAAIGAGTRVALLKGRANYLCLHRLALAGLPGGRRRPVDPRTLEQLRSWARRTVRGDRAEVAMVPEDSPVWPQVTSTADNCLGGECPEYRDCFVVKARREAQEASLLVVNHHLMFADMVLKDTGFGELLPGADAIVVDEAHQLPEIAGRFLGVSVSSRQLAGLARDAAAEQKQEAPEFGLVGRCARVLEHHTSALRDALGAQDRRAPWAAVGQDPPVAAGLATLAEALGELKAALEEGSVRGKGLEHCFARSRDLEGRLGQMLDPLPEDMVRWFETHGRGFALNQTPLEVGPGFRQLMARYPGAWIFTSATLAVGERFDHFVDRLDLDAPRTLRLESPFDFRHHALLYLPPGMPAPNTPGYTPALVDAVVPLLEASGGRTFMLFTSHRALREAAGLLEARVPFPLLAQGSLPRAALLDRFRALGNAVLLGTSSFWEGVDVRGPALSCVVIDKLPFAAPSDPLVEARIDAIRRRGGDPFSSFQLPQAAIALKQGVGRLIRDARDRGVMVIGDPRLTARAYGRVFLESLPPMPRSDDLARVTAFLRELTVPER